jgi:GDSL-like lipase/acylhydrolase family protein
MYLRGLLARAAMVIASIAVAILLTELALAIFLPQERSIWARTRDEIVIHPASFETYYPQFKTWIRTNSWGMRDRPHGLEKPEGTFRILVLGDSFMEAVQVDFEQSLPSLLETELVERTGRTIEVINAGVSGWGTDDELTYLERYGLRFSPDLVLIAMTLHNDVSDNLELEYHDFRHGRIVERPREEFSRLGWPLIRLREYIANHMHLYSVYSRLKTLRRSQVGVQALNSHVISLIRRQPDERKTAGWEMTRQLMDETREVARAAGAHTAVFLIPLFIQASPERLDSFLSSQGLKPSDIELDQPQRLMAEWGARAAVEVIDLAPDFRAAYAKGASLYLVDDGHWNRAGHALAAEIVARELVRQGLVGGVPGDPAANPVVSSVPRG